MKKIYLLTLTLMCITVANAQDKSVKTVTTTKSNKTVVTKKITAKKSSKAIAVNSAKAPKLLQTETTTTVTTKKTEVKSIPAKDTSILKPTRKGATYYIDARGVKTYVGS